jgi:carbon catabolite-derepressing protein kinase
MSDTESETPEIYPASKLGEYTVLRDVAEGTFGKVKSASQPPPAPPTADPLC